MCLISRNPDRKILPIEIFEKTIDDLEKLGCYYVGLSGGDPLVISNILDYVSYAKSKIPFVNLTTNGYSLSADVARGLGAAGLDMLSLSIDGFEETHDFIRNKKGAFKQAIKAIENMKTYAPEVGITVNTIIAGWNLEEIIPLSKLIKELNVYHKFQPVYPHKSFADGQREEQDKWISREINVDRLTEIIAFLKKQKNVSNSRYFLSLIPDYFLAKVNRGLFVENKCSMPDFYCEFREDGCVYPCILGMDWERGFSVRDGFKSVFFSEKYQSEIKRLKEKCHKCQQILSICYFEPRIVFPIKNFIRYNLLGV